MSTELVLLLISSVTNIALQLIILFRGSECTRNTTETIEESPSGTKRYTRTKVREVRMKEESSSEE